MNRRHFLYRCAGAVALAPAARSRGAINPLDGFPSAESVLGNPCNLAWFGEIRSWLSPEATPLLQNWAGARYGAPVRKSLRLAELQWKGAEFDLGVEWPEFRTVNQVVVRFTAEDRAPERGKQFVEFWDGITTLQGTWRTLEDNTILGIPLEGDGRTWRFDFPERRTCKVRLRLQGQRPIELESFEVFGPSKWKWGEVYIEWGHPDSPSVGDGSLSIYNGALLELRPAGEGVSLVAAQPYAWTSRGGKKQGIIAKVLYTSGMDVDRTVATLRAQAFDFSFLPGEALEYQPIDIPDFGVYIRNNALDLDRDAYRQKHAKAVRIMDAVVRRAEQTIENAYRTIRAKRVTLSFAAVDSNSQKFGVAPDGHLVIGNNDPSYGRQIAPKHTIYFASSEATTLFQEAAGAEDPFEGEREKPQELEEGWLPHLITRWSRNEVSLERLDYATLHPLPQPLVEENLTGNELSLLISRLRIRNGAPAPKTVSYYLKPWKPPNGGIDYEARPGNLKNAWETVLRGNWVWAIEGKREQAVCCVDTGGRGSLAPATENGAVRYSLELDPGEEHVIHLVTPGRPLADAEAGQLSPLPYESIHDALVNYWKGCLAEGMQVELPEARLQNLYNATLPHFLLAQTKDAKRQERYANAAMFYYGAIGTESSPIIQSLDMRGLHKRAESCLNAWLSTQGDSLPSGDYRSKEGGFYHYWPNYTLDQGGVLWALAEHYLYTRDKEWLRKAAPQIAAGCEFILRERKRLMQELSGEPKPLYYGLAPAGCVADLRDWEYSFMLNAYFYLGLKKSAEVLRDVEPAQAQEIATEAEDYRQAIRRALKESVGISPVTRLRDGTSVPSVPSYVGLRGLSVEVKDSVDPDLRHGYASDTTIGPLHLLKGEVLEANDPEVTWILNYLEDRFFLFTPLPSRVQFDELSTDWFNLGGFEKLQPYYVHYQDAYLQRDQIPHFLRGFFNTLAAISDHQTLTFQEELDFSGAQPHKTHEEAWFFHQLRHMLVMEMENELFLARGTPREWLAHGKKISVSRAPTYFGEIAYHIESFVSQNRIEATVQAPSRQAPSAIYLRLRHPKAAAMQRVTVNGRPWKDWDAAKEWIKLPGQAKNSEIVAYYS